jgi:zinc transporter ZupT
MLCIGFHSFIDGVIYSIAFTVSILTGFLATMGMIPHEFPEGIITYLLPPAEQENKRFSLVALAGGVLVAVIIVVSKS